MNLVGYLGNSTKNNIGIFSIRSALKMKTGCSQFQSLRRCLVGKKQQLSNVVFRVGEISPPNSYFLILTLSTPLHIRDGCPWRLSPVCTTSTAKGAHADMNHSTVQHKAAATVQAHGQAGAQHSLSIGWRPGRIHYL